MTGNGPPTECGVNGLCSPPAAAGEFNPRRGAPSTDVSLKRAYRWSHFRFVFCIQNHDAAQPPQSSGVRCPLRGNSGRLQFDHYAPSPNRTHRTNALTTTSAARHCRSRPARERGEERCLRRGMGNRIEPHPLKPPRFQTETVPRAELTGDHVPHSRCCARSTPAAPLLGKTACRWRRLPANGGGRSARHRFRRPVQGGAPPGDTRCGRSGSRTACPIPLGSARHCYAAVNEFSRAGIAPEGAIRRNFFN